MKSIKVTEKPLEIPRMDDVIGVILAGGEGSRLGTLTDGKAKAMVTFGGIYTPLTFTISSFVNSDIDVIKVLVQKHSPSILKYLGHLWPSAPAFGKYIDPLPPQTEREWYEGTADAVLQNLDQISKRGRFKTALIAPSDNVLKMDARLAYHHHKKKGSSFTICAVPFPIEKASELGVLEVDENYRVVDFVEKPGRKPKPEWPKPMPDKPGYYLVSMGVYLSEIEYLSSILKEKLGNDFGDDIIPAIIKRQDEVFAYNCEDNLVPGQNEFYWRDIGTIRAFFDAHMDLVAIKPKLNLYDIEERWPILTSFGNVPPFKSVDMQSLISHGCIINASYVKKAVLSPWVLIEKSWVENVIIFSKVEIYDGSHIKNAIISKNVVIPPNTYIGFNHDDDRKRGFEVVDGITIIPKDYRFC